jgi:ribonucleoside-diphosphate reductase alpha chain
MSETPLPDRRRTVRQKLRIGGTKVYCDLGMYDDGTPGEVFIVVERTGAERRFLYDETARLASKLLQHGCSLEHVAEGWLGTRGQPAGPVQGHPRIKHATSVLDLIARYLLVDYCGREDLAHVKEST